MATDLGIALSRRDRRRRSITDSPSIEKRIAAIKRITSSNDFMPTRGDDLATKIAEILELPGRIKDLTLNFSVGELAVVKCEFYLTQEQSDKIILLISENEKKERLTRSMDG